MASLADFRVGSKDAHAPNALWVVGSASEMLKPTGLPHADLTWKAHAVPGTFGFEFIEGLPDVSDYSYMVWKGIEVNLHPYGACYHDDKMSTGVIEWLNSREVKVILVGGLALDYCVKFTVLELLAAGFVVVVHLPATRGIAKETVDTALAEMIAAGAIISETPEQLSGLVQQLTDTLSQ